MEESSTGVDIDSKGDGNRPWMYLDGVNSIQRGPVHESAMIKLIMTGMVGRETQAWSAGMSEWESLEKVKALALHRCSRLLQGL
ncbi:unnamed protein product [Choristocarpus tenellus]